MLDCHLCHHPWLAHAPDCRVPDDLVRMRRVRDRLAAEGREPELRQRIDRYLADFGTLACQRRDGTPAASDCEACGYGDVCVVRPHPAA